MSVPPNKGFQD